MSLPKESEGRITFAAALRSASARPCMTLLNSRVGRICRTVTRFCEESIRRHPPAHHLIHRSGEFDPRLTRHTTKPLSG
jgi:hypothetical protein